METNQTEKSLTVDEIMDKIHQVNLEMLKAVDNICQKYDIQYYVAAGTLLGAVRHQGFIPWDNDIDVYITRENFEKFRLHCDELPDEYLMVLPELLGPKKYSDSLPRLSYRYMYIKMDEEVCRYYQNINNRVDLDFFFIDKTYDDWRGKLQRYELIVLYGLMNAYKHKSSFEHYPKAQKLINHILRLIGRCIPLDWMRTHTAKIANRYNHREDAHFYFTSNGILVGLLRLRPVEYYGEPQRLKFEDTTVLAPQNPDALLRIFYGDYMKLPPENKRTPHWGSQLLDPKQFAFEEPPQYN